MDFLSKLKLPFRGHKPAAPALPQESPEQLRTRARRRLVGTAMLLLLGVVVLPLLFEGRPRPVSGAPVFVVPERDGVPELALPPVANLVGRGTEVDFPTPLAEPSASGLTSVPVFVPAPAAKGASAPKRAASGGASVPVMSAAVPTTASVAMAAASSASALRPAPARPAASGVIRPVLPAPAELLARAEPAKPAVPAAPPAPAERASAPEKPAKPSKLAQATPPPTPPATPDAAAQGRYIVQIGAFTDDASVRSARMRAEGLGLKTYVQVLGAEGERRIRVRIGPYASKTEADKAASRLKSAGLGGNVLAL